MYPCPSVSRFPGQLATLWPGYNPHDGDALVRNSNESLQASPRASVSPEASDRVSPRGKKGSKEGLYRDVDGDDGKKASEEFHLLIF